VNAIGDLIDGFDPAHVSSCGPLGLSLQTDLTLGGLGFDCQELNLLFQMMRLVSRGPSFFIASLRPISIDSPIKG
jgi:hypothetical protein